jgi:membrane-associated phospholipid phosphatase
MSILLEKTAEAKVRPTIELGFHLHMAFACSACLLIALLACRLASIHIEGILNFAIGLAFASAVVFTIAVYWHEKGRANLRDAILTIPWSLFLAVTMPLLVLAAARLDMPLQDERFTHLDQVFGVSVPGIMAWASHHWLGGIVNRTYTLLSPLIVISALVPALTGKVRNAQQFVLANLIAFVIGLPLFALLPAIGPWYGYSFAATSHQMDCQSSILLFRAPGHQISHLDAIICFPSFHVIWAIFCAAALWGFRPLRIPVAVFSGMIVVSTVTTGWHYFIDVAGGIAVACLSLAVAKSYMDKANPCLQQLESGAGR